MASAAAAQRKTTAGELIAARASRPFAVDVCIVQLRRADYRRVAAGDAPLRRRVPAKPLLGEK